MSYTDVQPGYAKRKLVPPLVSSMNKIPSGLKRLKKKNKRTLKPEPIRVFDHDTRSTKTLKPLYQERRLKRKNKGGSRSVSLHSGQQSPSSMSEAGFSDITSISSRMKPFTGLTSTPSTSSIFMYGLRDSGDSKSQSFISSSKRSDSTLVRFENPFSGQSISDDSSFHGDFGDGAGNIMSEFGSQTSVERKGRRQTKEEMELEEKMFENLRDQEFVINLKESETFFLFENDERVFSELDERVGAILKQNEKYVKLKKKKREEKDRYISREIQTLDSFLDRISKDKFTNAKKILKESKKVGCTEWKMWDELQERERLEREKKEREQLELLEQQQTNTEEDDEEDDEDDEDEDELEEIEDDGGKDDSSGKMETDVFSMEKFATSLMRSERIVLQNLFNTVQTRYRTHNDVDESKEEELERKRKLKRQLRDEDEEEGDSDDDYTDLLDDDEDDNEKDMFDDDYDDFSDEDSEEELGEYGLGLKREKNRTFRSLLFYECPLVEKQSVNYMCWNRENRDILAVGYGNLGYDVDPKMKKGNILCWCIKNPVYPERKYSVSQKCVTSLDFSKDYPFLISAGFDDGSISIYDVRKRENDPVLESQSHNGAVWDMRWVNRGKDLGERLHTVGCDGRVFCWSIKKGLECQEIMYLKSVGGGHGEGYVSRETGGLCFDFFEKDLYLVGSEDGVIYKCSTSYNEQYLHVYNAHNGPVYNVKWCPTDPKLFLSCSGDWTINLWEDGKDKPIESFEPYNNLKKKRTSAITGIAWNPYTSQKMFCCVSLNGVVEMWETGRLKPRLTKTTHGVEYNCVTFAEAGTSPCVVVGDNIGKVEILKPMGLYK